MKILEVILSDILTIIFRNIHPKLYPPKVSIPINITFQNFGSKILKYIHLKVIWAIKTNI